MSAANNTMLGLDESVKIFPPTFIHFVLWKLYIREQSDEALRVPRYTFTDVVRTEFSRIRIFRVERGICATYMAFKHKLRMVAASNVDDVADAWVSHLNLAFISRDG